MVHLRRRSTPVAEIFAHNQELSLARGGWMEPVRCSFVAGLRLRRKLLMVKIWRGTTSGNYLYVRYVGKLIKNNFKHSIGYIANNVINTTFRATIRGNQVLLRRRSTPVAERFAGRRVFNRGKAAPYF